MAGHPPQLSSAGEYPGIELVDVRGTSRACGKQLGRIWKRVLSQTAGSRKKSPQWWRQRKFSRLVGQHMPHLPDLYEGMAEGATVAPGALVIPTPVDLFGGCTSFAIEASATLNGHPLCGQTKDTGISRVGRYQVLRIIPNDAPASLTLTYPGMLFGHGFVTGRCAVFRNSLYAGNRSHGELPYNVWGLLALHCTAVSEVIELLQRFGVNEPFHCTVCDSVGSIIGIENGIGGVATLSATNHIYTHANNVLSGGKMLRSESVDHAYVRSSNHRRITLQKILSHDRNRLTPQLAYHALSSHSGYPRSICNHESADFCTTAAVIAEPSTGRLWVTSGPPCMTWPTEYSGLR